MSKIIKEPLLSLFEQVAFDINYTFPLVNMVNLTLFFKELDKHQQIKQDFYTDLLLNNIEFLNKDSFIYDKSINNFGAFFVYATVMDNIFNIVLTPTLSQLDNETVIQTSLQQIHIDTFLEKMVLKTNKKTCDDLAVLLSQQFKEPSKNFLEKPFVIAFIDSFSNKWSNHSMYNKTILEPKYKQLLCVLLESKEFITNLKNFIILNAQNPTPENSFRVLSLYVNLIDLLKDKENLTKLESFLFESFNEPNMAKLKLYINKANDLEDQLYTQITKIKNNDIITSLSKQTNPIFNKELFSIYDLYISILLLTNNHQEKLGELLTGKRNTIYCPLSLEISNNSIDFFNYLIKNPLYLKTIEKHYFYIFNDEEQKFKQTDFKNFVNFLLRNNTLDEKQAITAPLFSLLEKHSFLNKLTKTENIFKRNLMMQDKHYVIP